MKILTTTEVREILKAHGIPSQLWWLPDRRWSTVSPAWVILNCQACLEAEPDELTKTRAIGGGKMVRDFRWIEECNDCETISTKVMSFGARGHALSVSRGIRKPTGNLLGVMGFVADEAYRRQTGIQGPHAPNWFIGHDGVFHVHEPQGNVLVNPSPESLLTAARGFAI